MPLTKQNRATWEHSIFCYLRTGAQIRISFMSISACFSIACKRMVRRCRSKLLAVSLLALGVICFTGLIDVLYRVHYSSPNLTINVLPPAVEPQLGKEEFTLLAIITSRPGSKSTRQTIRQTWGSLHGTGTAWKVIFNLGRTFEAEKDLQLEKEAAIHADLFIGNYKDTYKNLILKVFTAFTWAVGVKCKFVLKADDDVYVHVPRLIRWLQSPAMPSRVYAGFLAEDTGVERIPWKTHFVSYKTYSSSRYHTYCRGPYYVMSHNILSPLWNGTKLFEPFPIEDAYVGLVIISMGITPMQVPGCSWKDSNSMYKLRHKDECFFTTGVCVGDHLTENALQYAHQRFTDADENAALHEKCLDNNKL